MHCLQECNSKPHFGHLPTGSDTAGNSVPHEAQRDTSRRAGICSGRGPKVLSFLAVGRELSRGVFLFLRYGPGIRAGDIFYRTRGLRSQLIGAIRVYSNQMSTISRIGRFGELSASYHDYRLH